MAPGGEEQSNGKELDHHIPIDGTCSSLDLVFFIVSLDPAQFLFLDIPAKKAQPAC